MPQVNALDFPHLEVLYDISFLPVRYAWLLVRASLCKLLSSLPETVNVRINIRVEATALGRGGSIKWSRMAVSDRIIFLRLGKLASGRPIQSVHEC